MFGEQVKSEWDLKVWSWHVHGELSASGNIWS